MDKLKVVQIGIGHDHGTSGFNSILSQDDIFEVLAFAVPDEELIDGNWEDRIKEYRDDRKVPMVSVEEALSMPGVEAAIVETEDLYLTKYSILAAEKGLHVYMDKPGGCELSEFERLIRIVKKKGLAFNVGYMYRFNPKIMEAIERIENGEIGEVYCVEAHMDCEYGPDKREWLSQFPGGMMFYLGCHLVDLVYTIQGEPLEVIPLNCATGFEGVDAKDYGMAVYRYKNGVSFVKSCSSEVGGYMRRQLVICGSKGTIEFKPLETFDADAPRDYLYTQMRVTHQNMGWQHYVPKERSEYYNRFNNMLRDFADVAKGRKATKYTYEHELNVYKMLLKSCGVHIDGNM